MRGADSTYRLRLVIIIVLGAAMTLGSFWVLEVMRKSSINNAPKITRAEPDFYVDNFEFIQVAKTGQIHYKMSGDRLTHEPLHDSYQITQPVITSLGQGRAPMTMRAKSATIEDDNSKVHLRQNVRIDRPAAGQSQSLHLETEYLLLLPDDDVMQTGQPVKLLLGRSTLSGNSLFANNATRQVRITGNVHGSFIASSAH